MNRRFIIPSEPYILAELQRLVEAMLSDNTDKFDIFENDMFVFFDPLIEEDTVLEEDEESFEIPGQEVDETELLSPEDGLERIAEFAEEDEEFIEDDDEYEVDPEILNEFSAFIPFDPHFMGNESLFNGILEDEDDEEPNFHHKPSDLKLWWRLDEENLYSNQKLKYRSFSRIITQCIASIGRRTNQFFIRFQYWGEDGDAKM
jgi:hypothetical protein